MANIATPEKTHKTLGLRLDQRIHQLEGVWHSELSREPKTTTLPHLSSAANVAGCIERSVSTSFTSIGATLQKACFLQLQEADEELHIMSPRVRSRSQQSLNATRFSHTPSFLTPECADIVKTKGSKTRGRQCAGHQLCRTTTVPFGQYAVFADTSSLSFQLCHGSGLIGKENRHFVQSTLNCMSCPRYLPVKTHLTACKNSLMGESALSISPTMLSVLPPIINNTAIVRGGGRCPSTFAAFAAESTISSMCSCTYGCSSCLHRSRFFVGSFQFDAEQGRCNFQ